MNKILKTILAISIAIFGAGFLLAAPAFAQNDNLVVKFETAPLFDEANFLPGQAITRRVTATNNSGQPQRIAAEAVNYPCFPNPNDVPDNDLSRALLIIISEKNGSDLYGGTAGEKTLFNFYQDGETYLSDITAGASAEYGFEINFPSEKENEWQNATTTFDVLVGFQGVEGGVPPGGGGGGGLPPGLTVNYEMPFYIGTTTAKITWLTSYKATSRVIYGTQAGKFDLNILPNYGYAFSTTEKDTPANPNGATSHEVWLTNLAPNTTYYYRAISHASPPTIGFEHSFTTLPTAEDYGGQISEPAGEPAEGAKEPEAPVTVLGIELAAPAESAVKKIAKIMADGAVKVLGIESEPEETSAEQRLAAPERAEEEIAADDLKELPLLTSQEQEQTKKPLGIKGIILIILFVLTIIIVLYLIIKKRNNEK